MIHVRRIWERDQNIKNSEEDLREKNPIRSKLYAVVHGPHMAPYTSYLKANWPPTLKFPRSCTHVIVPPNMSTVNQEWERSLVVADVLDGAGQQQSHDLVMGIRRSGWLALRFVYGRVRCLMWSTEHGTRPHTRPIISNSPWGVIRPGDFSRLSAGHRTTYGEVSRTPSRWCPMEKLSIWKLFVSSRFRTFIMESSWYELVCDLETYDMFQAIWSAAWRFPTWI
jgi:hypothetical protein